MLTTPDAPPDPERTRPPKRRHASRAVEWAIVAVVAALVAVGLRAFVVQTFFVPSGSMLPTLQIGDRMLIDKLPWVRDDIRRGDIIVFRRTPQDSTTNAADLVKRVIGLPGDTVASGFVHTPAGLQPTVLIDGKPLAEPWLPPLGGLCAQSNYGIQRQVVPAGRFFVLGDCRGNSEDSRYWGTVPAGYIVGKVAVVIWRHGHPWFHWF